MATSRIYHSLHLDISTFGRDRICYVILPEKLKESELPWLDRMAEQYDPELCDTVFIGHGDCAADAEFLANAVKERFGVKHVFIHYIGAVVGSHTGPGVATVFFFGKHR